VNALPSEASENLEFEAIERAPVGVGGHSFCLSICTTAVVIVNVLSASAPLQARTPKTTAESLIVVAI
jgi:hypothetical protein